MPLNLTIIATVGANGVIGADGMLPWPAHDYIDHFHTRTKGSPVLVGRHTYENLTRRVGGPLPGRKHVVLTTDDDYTTPSPVTTCSSIPHAVTTLQNLTDETAYVAGGESVYQQTLERASQLVLIELDRVYDGDAYFPEITPDNWTLTETQATPGHATVKTYERPDRVASTTSPARDSGKLPF